MADEKILTYKGHPLMRKDNLIYYGSMADTHIIMLQILETKKVMFFCLRKLMLRLLSLRMMFSLLTL
jgi:hypothetical protein